MQHVSEWTGLPCIRKDCDGVGHVSQATQFSTQESHLDGEEEVG